MNETTIVYNSQKSSYLAKCGSLNQEQEPQESINRFLLKEEKPLENEDQV